MTTERQRESNRTWQQRSQATAREKARMTKRAPIRAKSARQAANEREYATMRPRFLQAHRSCMVCYRAPSVEIHHMRGRAGARLTDVRYFLATCTGCHRHIHDNPAEAHATGNLISRHERRNDEN